MKEGTIGSDINVLTIAGETSSQQPVKIILTANYTGLPLNGTCTVRAFVCDEKNARITDWDGNISFALDGNGNLAQAQVTAVNGLAEVEFQAAGEDEVVIVSASGSGLTGDYVEIYIGSGLLQNTLVSAITVSGFNGATTITAPGGTLQLSANVLPDNATNRRVSWSVQNGTGQASISASGLVTAIADGTVTATATATDGSGITGNLQLTLSNQSIPTGIGETDALAPVILVSNLELSIRFPAGDQARDIMLINQLGMMVRNQKAQSDYCTLDVSALSSGIYFVVVNEGGKSTAVKVLKP
jgi:hypothetical protein